MRKSWRNSPAVSGHCTITHFLATTHSVMRMSFNPVAGT
jgi:hypothetical protein